jgi:hypothetical protein
MVLAPLAAMAEEAAAPAAPAAVTETAAPVSAATPQELFDMVTKGAYVMEKLGEDGLAAFNDPKGEFMYKDSYVYVISCKEDKVVGHPSPKVRGLTSDGIKCYKTGVTFMKDACKNMSPDGFWLEYWWPKLGEEKQKERIFRKIGFAIPVSGRPYQVGSAIYNEDLSIEELKKLSVDWQSKKK